MTNTTNPAAAPRTLNPETELAHGQTLRDLERGIARYRSILVVAYSCEGRADTEGAQWFGFEAGCLAHTLGLTLEQAHRLGGRDILRADDTWSALVDGWHDSEAGRA